MRIKKLNDTIKSQISFVLFLLVNFIFSTRYLSRITDYYILVSFCVLTFYVLIYLSRKQIVKWQPQRSFINILILVVFITASSIAFQIIPAESLDVDRWSVITSFWDTYLSGDYAYYAKSNVGNEPGPMPFYYILALPFYLIGELGYFSILGILVFVAVLRLSIIPIQYRTIAILLVLTSVSYLWEVVCRSNIFLNSTLVLLAIILFLSTPKYTLFRLILLGIIIGLVMSTRNVVAIPLIIAGLYQLKTGNIKFSQAMIISVIAIIIFAATFLPFIINHMNDFLIMNPFIVQSSFLVPFEYTILFLFLAVLFGLLCRSTYDVYFYSGLVLFVSILIYFLYHISISSFKIAFFDAQADISYFILSMPFLLYHCLVVDSDKVQRRVSI